jgi:hypothetical protein
MAQEDVNDYDEDRYDIRRRECPKAEIDGKQFQFMGTGLREESVYEETIRVLVRDRVRQAEQEGIEVNLGTLTLAMQRAYTNMIRWKNEMGVSSNQLIELNIKFLKQEIPEIVRAECVGLLLSHEEEEVKEQDMTKWEVDESEDDWSEEVEQEQQQA